MNDNPVTAQVSSTQWTDEQTRAMELRGGNVLVSASAGSGKTAVLTERLLRMIVEGGADVRDFVVVTFTKAAAAEMKARLGKKLSDYSRSHPENARVKCQLMHLPEANISTIDSFCLALLEKYQSAEGADYSPGVRILSENEAKLIFKKALADVVEEEYDRGEDGFYALADALSSDSGGVDSLKKAITSLHYILAASPESETLKDEYVAAYGEDYPAAMLRFALENAAEAAEYHARAINGVIAEAPTVTEDTPPKEKDKLQKCVRWLAELADSARSVAEAARAGDHARCVELMSVEFQKADGKPSNTTNPWYDRRKDVGNGYKNFMKSAAASLSAAENGLADEAAELREIVSRLFDLTPAVEERYAALKKDRAAWDFADIEKKALKLLWKRGEDGVLRRTDVSLEEGARYKEILIDEYQDVNMLQERIFLGVCAREDNEEENNVFTVGDIKQSIYGFRGATPELFRRRRADYLPATPEDAEFPAKIVLNHNFRSRKSVLDAVNAVFGAIMTEETCGIDYAEDAMKKLDGAADRDNPGSGAYLTLFSDPDKRGEYVAAKIAELMRSGMKVVEGRGANRTERDLRYGDVAILMRSVKHKYCKPYLDAFEAAGIPCADPGSAGCFDVPSVRGVISVLRAVDNPMKDVSLVAAMVSPVFGFTESELMRVRGGDKGVFYYSVKAAAEAGDAKCADFIARLEHLRRKAAVLTADKLIWYIYSSTGCLAFASSLKTGKRDRAALMRFYESAKSYGASGRQDLSGFIGFVDRMIEEEADSDGGYASGTGDEVRIMTVHKSKGLEFPVCFICGTESPFSMTDNDLKRRCVVDPDIGVAAGIVRPSEHKKLSTAAFRAAKEKLRLKKRREDIRALYVAMTRACERLEIVSSVNDPDALREDALHRLDAAGRMDAYDVKNASRSLDWIVPAAVCSGSFTVSADPAFETAAAAPEGGAAPEPDAALSERIRERINAEYGYAASAAVPTKLTVSDIVAARAGRDESERCCERRPACLDADKRGGTEAGTATHAFLQFADYDALGDPEAELARLVSQRFITERQAELVDRRKLDNFICSELFGRIRAAESSTREFRFTFEAAASDFIPGAPDEKLLVQGAIDCVFEENGRCVVVDYKTDRIKDNTAEKVAYYKPQLEIYARGLRELTGKEVSEGILFFLDTGEAVRVW